MDYRYYDSHYYPRYSAIYHQQYPQNDYIPRVTRSYSTGTTNYYSYQQDYNYVDYPQVTTTRKKRRNKIDRFVYEHLDGEPMNDLEVIAAKNAAKNERKSKIVYPDYDDELFFPEKQQDSVSPLNSMMATLSVSSLESTLVDTDSNNTIVKEDNIKEDQQFTAKKNRWPFAYLFKKRGPIPTPSASTPPTPVLSPENNSDINNSPQLSSSSITTNTATTTTPTSSTPSYQEIIEGSWAFAYPSLVPMIPAVWVKFDNDNQKRIKDHVRSSIPVVQFTDSNIGGNRLLITVIPSQMACFIPFPNQITRLQLNYILPNNTI